jgi:hypothetical protein
MAGTPFQSLVARYSATWGSMIVIKFWVIVYRKGCQYHYI